MNLSVKKKAIFNQFLFTFTVFSPFQKTTLYTLRVELFMFPDFRNFIESIVFRRKSGKRKKPPGRRKPKTKEQEFDNPIADTPDEFSEVILPDDYENAPRADQDEEYVISADDLRHDSDEDNNPLNIGNEM